MKWSKKFRVCSLAAGLILSIQGCRPEPGFTLLRTKTLSYPSASAIEYYDNKLYVFGDDASSLLVLDTNYNEVDQVTLIKDSSSRISKELKHDIESATLLHTPGGVKLFALSSGVTPNRNYFFQSSLTAVNQFQFSQFSYEQFRQNLKVIPEINIEGLAMVNNKWIMSNRANQSQKDNLLIIADSLPFKKANGKIKIQKAGLNTKNVAGISGLYYLPEKDLLLFTASEEQTTNAYADGAIGDSYIGWIEDYSSKLSDSIVQSTKLLNLSASNKAFSGQKLESLCVEKVTDKGLVMHLIADNDNGSSRAFKLLLKL